ncbi:hypothetical protein OHQ88_29990 [Micromonospora zamorensis]|uniref:hypothetical protein n=1 Tax=Micromonospora zamorensis TaxID=709883 RepID=UPI002E2247AB|nr:hypothetical protein OG423_13375 [Micromonospora zamorensis]
MPAGSPCGRGGWSARRCPRRARFAAERVALTALIARGDRVDVPGLFGRLTAAHTARMAAAGLNN